MRTMGMPYKSILAATLFMVVGVAAQAAPGDDEAVANARKEYEKAMQGHDVGLQNAMKIQLSVQLAKSKERAAKKEAHDTNKTNNS